jgi:hypothetical protein
MYVNLLFWDCKQVIRKVINHFGFIAYTYVCKIAYFSQNKTNSICVFKWWIIIIDKLLGGLLKDA